MSYDSSPISLSGACAVVHDNTLYAYSPAGFVKLPLTTDAEWTTLASGEAVTGGTCVGSDSALFILGGTSTNADYDGLQKYDYSAATWTSLTPSDTVLKNRLGMSAAYIAATDSFITYGGRTDGAAGIASETFSIKASSPFTVSSATNPFSYTLQTPIMVDWVAGEVLMAGGSTTNLDIIIYNAGTNTWRSSGATLADPVAKITNKGYLQVGTDGSKSLYTFDLAQSPVRVTRSVIVDATGGMVTNAATVVAARDLTATSWPTYNSTFAPTGSSSDAYASAADSSGEVYFITSDSKISAFGATDNSWVDIDSQLGAQSVLATDVSSTSASGTSTASSSTSSDSSSVSSSASPTTTGSSSSISASITTTASSSATAGADTKNAAAAASSSASSAASATATVDAHLATTNKDGLTKTEVVGAIMGSVLGFALLMIGVFLYTRSARRKKGYTGEKARKGQHYPGDEKNVGMSNEEFIDSLGGPPGSKVKRQNTVSMQSNSSIGIFGGKSAAAAPVLAARAVSPSGGSLNRRNSEDSIIAFNREFKNKIGKPVLNDASSLPPNSADGRVSINATGRVPPKPPGGFTFESTPAPESSRRSSGWNKYWSGNSASVNVLGYGNAQTTSIGDASSVSNYGNNGYSSGSNPNRLTQDSATVPPLVMPPEGRPELNRVATGSPTVSHYTKYIPAQAQVATLERPMSDAPSAYSSGVPPSVADAWGQQSVYGQPGQPGQSNPYGQPAQPGLAMSGPPSDMSWLNLGEYNKRS